MSGGGDEIPRLVTQQRGKEQKATAVEWPFRETTSSLSTTGHSSTLAYRENFREQRLCDVHSCWALLGEDISQNVSKHLEAIRYDIPGMSYESAPLVRRKR